MADKNYEIPETPEYSEEIRELQDSDPASASGVFNPLFQRIIENVAAVKRWVDKAVPNTRKVNNKPLSSDISLSAGDVGAAPTSHTHTKSEISDFPTSMPASDVSAWAKMAQKPSYTASEVGALPSNGTAAAATKLATSRTIRTNLASTSAASFNGTENATPGVSGVLGVGNGGTGNNMGTLQSGKAPDSLANDNAFIIGKNNYAICYKYDMLFGTNNIAASWSSAAFVSHGNTENNSVTTEGKIPGTIAVGKKVALITMDLNSTYAHIYTVSAVDSNAKTLYFSENLWSSDAGPFDSTHYDKVAILCSLNYKSVDSGNYSLTVGNSNISFGDLVIGKRNTLSSGLFVCGLANYCAGEYSIIMGTYCKNTARESVLLGNSLICSVANQTVIGIYNKEATNASDRFVIGKGTNSARANCFRVTDTGVYATGAHNSTGADYAELFEWADNNPDSDDRVGRFVTLDGDRISLAGPESSFILGIITGNPSVVGDVHDDQWQGMYLYDIFGRPIWEDVEVPDETMELPDPGDPEKTMTQVIVPSHTVHRQKLNPQYDNSQKYIPRTERPEWGCVGLMGKLVAVDDGSCQVNGWCAPGEGGIAVASDKETKFRVMERLDDTHVRVLIL